MTFNEKVQKYGSVSAALAASGYSNNNGTWTKSENSSSTPAASSSSNNASTSTNKSTTSSNSSGSSSNKTTSTPAASTSSSSGYYDPNIDYSLAIKNATDQKEIERLQAERQNKINDMYYGKDPYLEATTNRVTGATTTPTNTASKYGSDWTPQTATKESNLNYNAVQAVQGGQSYGDFLNSVAATTGDARDAALAWAKAGGSVPYTSGPNAGKDAWSLAKEGYNTNLDPWLNSGTGLFDKLVDDDLIDENGNLLKGADAVRETVDEWINQKKLWAKANGYDYNPMADFNFGQALIGAPQMGSTGAGGPGATQTQTPNGAGVQNAIGPNGSGSGSSSNTNININGGNGGNYTGAAPSLYDYLEQWMQNATKQQQNAIDWATSQQIQETLRAQQEADAQFQNTRDQIAIDEAKAKDNQALYAETRGDKGGIGASQYDAIMNTAAQNRLSVNQAQTKMASDTAQTIANLRAQGEYEKADALLELSQTYLAQLISLEQWSAEYGLSVAQFQAQLDQWKKDYELNLAQVMGTYNGTPTLENQKYQDSLALNQQETLADQGWKALSLGVTPSPSQLKAMGVTADQVNTYLTSQQLKNAPSKGTNPNPGADVTRTGTESDLYALYQAAYNEMPGNPDAYIRQHYKEYGFDSATGLLGSNGDNPTGYYKWASNYSRDAEGVSWIAKQWVDGLNKDYATQDDRLLEIYKAWTNNDNATLTTLNNAGNVWGESKGWMTEEDLDYLLTNLGL